MSPIFTMQRYASVVLAVVVCLSVCLSVPRPTGGAYNVCSCYTPRRLMRQEAIHYTPSA